jgi:hypothetical protein
VNLLPVLTGGQPFPRKVYWRYKFNEQRAMRDGDMKYLKVRDNTFLFNVVDDPQERANLSRRQQAVYQRMVSDYENWVSTMLPIDPQSNSGGMSAATTADRPGNGRGGGTAQQTQ